MENHAKYVTAKIYNATKAAFQFPEKELSLLKRKKNVGLCFSGGGTRSASLTLGQLRGLKEIQVLDQIAYLSAVSGGSWGSLPYLFLDASIPDDTFLGPYLKPQELSVEGIRQLPQYSMAGAIASSGLFDDLIKNLFSGDERYSNIINDIFLKPFNIGNRHKFFTYNSTTLANVLSYNPQLEPGDFYTMNPNGYRPFPIVGGTIVRPKLGRYQFEMTPLYVGLDGLFKEAGSRGKYDIGGGYIEPHGFDSDSPDLVDADKNLVYVRLGRPKRRFTLGDILGVSGAAPAEYADRLGLEWLGFPEFKYWSPISGLDAKAKEYDFADGGVMENLGIMPMLKRGVDKLLIFVNCQTPLNYGADGKANIASSIPALFHQIRNQNGEGHFRDNIVFMGQEEKYKQLVDGLMAKIKNGEPAIHTDTYQISDQAAHNIKGGRQVEIMWVYNSRIGQWVEQLPIEVKQGLEEGSYGKRFPLYLTFMENFPRIIDMKPEQVNLMAHQAAWSMVQSKKTIQDFIQGASTF